MLSTQQESVVEEEALPLISAPSLDEIAAQIPEEGLREFRPKHLTILSLYMTAQYTRTEIARLARVSEPTVTRVIQDPLAQKMLQRQRDEFEDDLSVMRPLALNTLRAGLTSSDEKTSLIALDKFFKATGLYKEKENTGDSAEDVMSRVLALQVNVNIDNMNKSDVSVDFGRQRQQDEGE